MTDQTEVHPMITLETLAGGAPSELFDAALADVLRNIKDVNMDWRAKRRISLEFDFTVNEDREVGKVTVSCSSKLAGMKGAETTVYIGRQMGELVAVEAPRQETLFPDQEARPRAVPRAESKE